MKGVIFTEFLEMMEDLMGLEFTNQVIENAHLENKGAYTSVGFYQHQDIIKLMESLNHYVKNPRNMLLKSYGELFFYRLSAKYPQSLKKYGSTFNFLQQAPQLLDQEIRKLEPQASIPDIKTELLSPYSLHLYYYSEEKMSYLLEGLIHGCIGQFEEQISLKRENLDSEEKKVRFVLLKVLGNERN